MCMMPMTMSQCIQDTLTDTQLDAFVLCNRGPCSPSISALRLQALSFFPTLAIVLKLTFVQRCIGGKVSSSLFCMSVPKELIAMTVTVEVLPSCVTKVPAGVACRFPWYY